MNTRKATAFKYEPPNWLPLSVGVITGETSSSLRIRDAQGNEEWFAKHSKLIKTRENAN